MFEILKTLLEEPERFKKFGIFLVRFILNVIFASQIYIWSFGEFKVIDITDIDAWSEFVLSGRILICILLYITSEVILFNLISIISLVPLDLIAKRIIYTSKPDKTEQKLIQWIFKKSEIFTFDEKAKKIFPAKNTDAFFEFLNLYNQKESKEEVSTLRNSFASDVLHTYFVFVLVYIFYIQDNGSYCILNWIVIIGCIALPLLYLAICGVIDFMDRNASKLIYVIRGIKFENLVYDVLKENGIYPADVTNPTEKRYEKLIYHNQKEYILKFHYGKRPVSEFMIQAMRDIFIKEEKRMIFITNVELTQNAIDIANEHKNSLLVITFKDESDLVLALEKYFKDK